MPKEMITPILSFFLYPISLHILKVTSDLSMSFLQFLQTSHSSAALTARACWLRAGSHQKQMSIRHPPLGHAVIIQHSASTLVPSFCHACPVIDLRMPLHALYPYIIDLRMPLHALYPYIIDPRMPLHALS